MPFRDPDAGDLAARIDTGLRERIEEQLDAACVEAIVRARETRGLPAPRADSAQDRREYDARLREFLELLRERLGEAASPEARPSIGQALDRVGDDPVARLTAEQVALARLVPDYWQRFEDTRRAYVDAQGAEGLRGPSRPPSSSSERGRSLLGRLLGRR